MQLVNTNSAAQTVTLTNSGNPTLTNINVATSSNFKRTTTCSTSLTAGAKCTINVAFAPNAGGTEVGTLQVTDNAGGSPQVVSLTGTSTFVKVAPSSLTFPTQTVLTRSTAQTVTITNTAAKSTLTLNSITVSGANSDDFTESANTCGGTLAAGASCTVSITFAPAVSGARTASLVISDSDRSSPQTVSLLGTG